jgi:hypothetical protein
MHRFHSRCLSNLNHCRLSRYRRPFRQRFRAACGGLRQSWTNLFIREGENNKLC